MYKWEFINQIPNQKIEIKFWKYLLLNFGASKHLELSHVYVLWLGSCLVFLLFEKKNLWVEGSFYAKIGPPCSCVPECSPCVAYTLKSSACKSTIEHTAAAVLKTSLLQKPSYFSSFLWRKQMICQKNELK